MSTDVFGCLYRTQGPDEISLAKITHMAHMEELFPVIISTPILVAGESKDFCKVQAEFLKAMGVRVVHQARHTRPALRLGRRFSFGLIITSSYLPGEGGVRLVEQLRASGGYEDVPIVMFTADELSEWAEANKVTIVKKGMENLEFAAFIQQQILG